MIYFFCLIVKKYSLSLSFSAFLSLSHTHSSLTHHSFIHSFIHSFTHSFTHSFIHSFIHSFTHSLTHSSTHSSTHSFIHPSTHSPPAPPVRCVCGRVPPRGRGRGRVHTTPLTHGGWYTTRESFWYPSFSSLSLPSSLPSSLSSFCSNLFYIKVIDGWFVKIS